MNPATIAIEVSKGKLIKSGLKKNKIITVVIAANPGGYTNRSLNYNKYLRVKR